MIGRAVEGILVIFLSAAAGLCAQDLAQWEELFRQQKYQAVVDAVQPRVKSLALRGATRKRALFLLGTSLAELKNFFPAASCLCQMLEEYPGPSEEARRALQALAGIYGQTSRPRMEFNALASLVNKVSESDTDFRNHFPRLLQLARSLGYQQKQIDLIKRAGRSLNDFPDAAIEASFAEASWLKETGNLRQAIEFYRDTTRKFPERPDVVLQALNGIAELYERRGEIEEADATYREILRRFDEQPQSGEIVLTVGRLWKRYGQYEKAAAVLREFDERVQHLPQRRALAMEFGELLALQTRSKEAIKVFRALTLNYPLSVEAFEAQRRICQLYLQLEDPARALAEAQRLLSVCSPIPEKLARHLGEAIPIFTSALYMARNDSQPPRLWLEYQGRGAAGQDRKFHTKDDLQARVKLADLTSNTDGASWQAAVDGATENSFAGRRKRGYLYLYQGRADSALEVFAENCVSAGIPDLETAFHDVAVGVKASTGTLQEAGLLERWLRIPSRKRGTRNPRVVKRFLPAGLAGKLAKAPLLKRASSMGRFYKLAGLARRALGGSASSSKNSEDENYLAMALTPWQKQKAKLRRTRARVRLSFLPTSKPPVLEELKVPLPKAPLLDNLGALETSLVRTYMTKAQESLRKQHYEHARAQYEDIIRLLPGTEYSFRATRGVFEAFATEEQSYPEMKFKQRAQWWLQVMNGTREAEFGKLLIARHEYVRGNAAKASADFASYRKTHPGSSWLTSIDVFLTTQSLLKGDATGAMPRLQKLMDQDQKSLSTGHRLSIAEILLLQGKVDTAETILKDLYRDKGNPFHDRISYLVSQLKLMRQYRLHLRPVDFKLLNKEDAGLSAQNHVLQFNTRVGFSYWKLIEKHLASGDFGTARFLKRFVWYDGPANWSKLQTDLTRIRGIYGDFE